MKKLTDEEKYEPKRIMRQNILYVVVLVAIVTAISLWRGTASAKVSPTKDGLTLSGHNGAVTLLYADMTDIQFFEAPDYGSPMNGATLRNWRYGTWESEELGTYDAYCSEKISSCILFITPDGRYAFNFENDENTKSLYDSIIEAWKK